MDDHGTHREAGAEVEGDCGGDQDVLPLVFLSTMNENGMSAFVEDESYPRRKLGAEQHMRNMDAGRLKLPA